MTDKITTTTPDAHTITMHKGGTGERTIEIQSIRVPDLWHVATRLREVENVNDAQLVMDTWHLAHAMKDHLQAQPAPTDRIELARRAAKRPENPSDEYLLNEPSIILVFLPDNTTTPFVTWQVGNNGNTFWGHYFDRIDQAVEDFENR